MTLEEANNFVFQELGFCGCGDPEVVLNAIYKVLEHIESFWIEVDAKKPGWGEKVKSQEDLETFLLMESRPELYYFFMYQLDRCGLTEHGSSVHTCWLTEKGKSFLAVLKEHGVQTVLRPEFEI